MCPQIVPKDRIYMKEQMLKKKKGFVSRIQNCMFAEFQMRMPRGGGLKGNAKIKSVLWQRDGLVSFLKHVFNVFITFVY